MSDRRGWRVLMVAVATIATATNAGAQAIAPDLQAAMRRASARFNTSAARLAELGRRADSISTARSRATNPETVQVGAIVAYVGGNARTPADVAAVGATLTTAWAEMQSALGSSAPRVAAAAPLHWRRDSLAYRSRGERSVVVLSLGKPSGPSHWLNPDSDPAETLDAVLGQYGDVAANLLPTQTRVWTGGWAPTVRPTAEQWERVAVVLATATSSRARDCYAGVIGECIAVLGLAPPADGNWWPVWYRPADLPAAVEEWEPKDPADVALARSCSEKHDAAACDLAITKFTPRSAVPSIAVNTLMALALERGGPDAFGRLTAARGSRSEVIRDVSGMDPNSLIAEWRARVYAARPPRPTPSLAQAGAMVFWAIAFGALATRRRP